MQNLLSVTLYATSIDFINKIPMALDSGIILQDNSNQHILPQGLFDMVGGYNIEANVTNFRQEKRCLNKLFLRFKECFSSCILLFF